MGGDLTSAGVSVRAGPITVSVEPGFVLVSVLIGLATGTVEGVIAWFLAVLVSVLVHELGHAVAFVAMGSEAKVRLYALGGLTSGRAGLSRLRHVTVSLAGPLAGLVVLGVPAALVQDAVPTLPRFIDLVVGFVVWASIGWSLLNLLPLVHLDGGHIARELLEAGLGDRAEVVAPAVSVVTAVVAAGVAWLLDQPFLAFYALFFVAMSYSALTDARAGPAKESLRRAHEAIDAGHIPEAVARADRLAAMRLAGDVRRDTLELPAWIAVRRGDPDGMDAVLTAFPPGVTPSGYLLATATALAGGTHEAIALALGGYGAERTWPPNRQLARVFAERGAIRGLVEALVHADLTDRVEAIRVLHDHLHHEGRYADAVIAGTAAMAAEPSPRGAYNLACSAARAGDCETAITALRRAVALGFADRSLATSDEDLAEVRMDRRWADIVDAMERSST